jgi:hypothetical protein
MAEYGGLFEQDEPALLSTFHHPFKWRETLRLSFAYWRNLLQRNQPGTLNRFKTLCFLAGQLTVMWSPACYYLPGKHYGVGTHH